jgi:hypothetical protein
MGELQLEDLMRQHEDPQAEFEHELEPRDVPSGEALNASIAGTPPGGSSTRLAHTLRRGEKPDISTIAMRRVERSAGLGIPRLFDRDLEDPTAILQAPLVAALASRTMPEAYRARTLEPLGTPGAGSAKASSSALAVHTDETRVIDALPRTDVPHHPDSNTPRRADSRPGSALELETAGEPRRPALRSVWQSRLRGAWQSRLRGAWQSRLHGAWQSRLIVPIALLVVFSAVCLLLRAIL